MKTCSRCKTEKELSEFYVRRNRTDGYSYICKKCDYGRKIEYRNGWISFWKSLYGEIPYCEVCGKQLSWESPKSGGLIYWDHRKGSNSVLKPSYLYGRSPCNSEKQEKWIELDFGILCNRCNGFLPTENRGKWLKKATEYYLKK